MKKTNVIFLNQWDLNILERQVNYIIRNIEKKWLEISDIQFKHCCSTIHDERDTQEDSYSVMIIYKAEDWEVIRDIEAEERRISSQKKTMAKYNEIKNTTWMDIFKNPEFFEDIITEEEKEIILHWDD